MIRPKSSYFKDIAVKCKDLLGDLFKTDVNRFFFCHWVCRFVTLKIRYFSSKLFDCSRRSESWCL